MQFNWNTSDVAHIALHDVVPEEAEQVVQNDPLDVAVQIRSGETRTLHLGETDAGRVLIVVVMVRGEFAARGDGTGRQQEGTGFLCRAERRSVMDKTLDTPEFKSEAEEAAWWDDNSDLVLKQFEQAAEAGMLGKGTLARRGLTPTTTIRLDPTDIALAKAQAEKRGIRYQTYLKMIIHQALRQAG